MALILFDKFTGGDYIKLCGAVTLNQTFHALSNPTRCEIVQRLADEYAYTGPGVKND